MDFRTEGKFQYNVGTEKRLNEDAMTQASDEQSNAEEKNAPADHDPIMDADGDAAKRKQRPKGERMQNLREKGQQPRSVHGHVMPAADIFKFGGLIAFIVLLLIAVALLWPLFHELFEPGGTERVLDQVRDAGPAGVFILLGIQFVQIVVAFIPGEVVQIAAGLIYGPWLGTLIILIGSVISSSFVFVLVHRLGAPFVHAMIPEKYVDKLEAFESSNKLNVIVFILFLMPGLPKDAFTYLVPLTSMKLSEFVVLTNLARLPGIFISTYAAAGLASGDYIESIVMFVILAVIAVVAIFVFTKIMNRRERKRESSD